MSRNSWFRSLALGLTAAAAAAFVISRPAETPQAPAAESQTKTGAADVRPEARRDDRETGLRYAEAIIAAARGTSRPSPQTRIAPSFAPYAAKQLDSTGSAAMLEAAVRLFQSEYNRSLMLGHEERQFSELAQRYFRKALELDPGIDKAWVLPQIDPKMIGMLAPGAQPTEDSRRRFEAAARRIRRVPLSAFPQLPAAVARVLGSRGCEIPQPRADGPAVNAIRGEFSAKGEAGWAVLCSSGGSSSILVFRDDSDGNPEELARTEDIVYLQDLGSEGIVYSREITAVGRDFIVQHYRAYGGPEPPPIDHQAIDDAFLEKASVVHYRYQRKWLQLQGAD